MTKGIYDRIGTFIKRVLILLAVLTSARHAVELVH
jgi:hypothetical protein